MTEIFINFRNGDETFAAVVVDDALARAFGRDAVFRSSRSLKPGLRWPDALLDNVAQCRLLVALIGPHWLNATDKHGNRRLWQPDDWVRREIECAHRLGRPILPVVLLKTPRLYAPDLPAELAFLGEIHGLRLDITEPAHDLAKMVDAVGEIIGRAPTFHRGPDTNAAGPATSVNGPWHMPARIPYRVDREGILDTVAAALSDASMPVVLSGLPGTGKTQLATEYAHRFAAEYDLVWWVSATQPELVPEQLADLARTVGIDVGTDLRRVVKVLFSELRRRGRWLLVYDDVAEPGQIRPFVLEGHGRVLVTSRNPHWETLGLSIEVGPFQREESVRVLQGLAHGVAPEAGDKLAEALGDLPLAVAQAGVFLRDASMSIGDFQELLASRARDVLASGTDEVYPMSLAATWGLAIDSLNEDGDGAAVLVEMMGCFAAAPVPIDLLVRAAGLYDEAAYRDHLSAAKAVRAMRRCGLLTVDDFTVSAHQLLVAYLESTTHPARRDALRDAARTALAQEHPGDPRDSATWPRFRILLPHVLALDLATAGVHRLLLDAAHFLVLHGNGPVARGLVETALDRWRGAQVAPAMLAAAESHLARIYFQLGDYEQALALDEGVLRFEQRRAAEVASPAVNAAFHDTVADRTALVLTEGRHDPGLRAAHEQIIEARKADLGAEHPDTLRSVHNFAVYLRAVGDVHLALTLDEQNLVALRSVLGDDHVDTLASAHALASDLASTGDRRASHDLNKETYETRLRLLGPDHPDTLASAYALAADLRALGDAAAALVLDRDTYQRRHRLYGVAHEATRRSAAAIARDHRALDRQSLVDGH